MKYSFYLLFFMFPYAQAMNTFYSELIEILKKNPASYFSKLPKDLHGLLNQYFIKKKLQEGLIDLGDSFPSCKGGTYY